jgi:hypothetical protein
MDWGKTGHRAEKLAQRLAYFLVSKTLTNKLYFSYDVHTLYGVSYYKSKTLSHHTYIS